MTIEEIIEIFCDVDDYVQEAKVEFTPSLLSGVNKKARRQRAGRLSDSEMMTLWIVFHRSGYRCFKHFYTEHVCKQWRHLFPGLLSYTRFINRMPRLTFLLTGFLTSRYGRNTGIAFIDSTKLAVCHNKRITRNKVFQGFAKRGKSSMGWFYGFKLHLVINDRGELLGVCLTKANVDDRKPVAAMTKGITGKLVGDKGYLSKQLHHELFERGLHLITQIRSNMNNPLLPMLDKLLLRKRSLIETVNDQLKNICQVEHTRHRSVVSFLINLLASLIAYTYLPNKPSLRFNASDTTALAI